MFLTFWIRLPFSKSAPLAIWAFMILSVSSINMGMNRRAMDIIMAISCTGTLMTFKKPSPFSRPSVRSFGVVVRVIRLEPMMSKIRRTAMRAARLNPSQVMAMLSVNCIMGVPLVRNRLKDTLKSSSNTMAFKPRTIYRKGTLDKWMTRARNRAPNRYPTNPFARNSPTI